MDKRTPEVVTEVVQEYLDLVQRAFPDWVEGCYIHGSIALGAYVENSSDIDFITIVNRHLSDEEIERLSNIHRQMCETHPTPTLEGVYLEWGDLGVMEDESQPRLHYDGHALHNRPFYNQNAVTWWILRHYGIPVLGPNIANLNFDADVKTLLEYVWNNMNSYWVTWLERARSIDITQLTNERVEEALEWSVLGILRQYFTIREHDVTPKLHAGPYGLKHLPAEWHKVIREAIRIRSGDDEASEYAGNEERVADVIAFGEYIIETCNRMAVR